MKFQLLTLASAKEKWATEADSLYTEKIGHFIKFEMIDLGSGKSGRDSAENKVKQESEKILKHLQKDDFVVLFDERGDSLSSEKFAKQIERIMLSGKKRATFIIGGAFGVSEEVKKIAQIKISLSSMVMNHLVAKTVAVEQIYRAFTIIRGLPYHNA